MKHDKILSLGRSQVPKPLFLFHTLCEKLGNPHLAYPVIHVAGTNGKGSVTFKIAKALEFAGYKVGLYTSPHLFELKERIVINSEPIPDESIEEISNTIFALSDEMPFFEMMTLMAFLYFKSQKVDVAVLETGLGGAFDPTNVCSPLLAIVTSIGLDHTEVLGKTLEEIAEAKAGIIKEKTPLVLGPKAHLSPLIQRAKALKAPLFLVEGREGSYDEENSAIAACALACLQKHFMLPQSVIQSALALRPRCRFEFFEGIVWDVAHNSDGINRLVEWLNSLFPFKEKIVLCGFSSDKDITSCLKRIARDAKRVVITMTSSQKSATVKDLENIVHKHQLTNAVVIPDIEDSLFPLLENYQKDKQILVITGSFYLMQSAFKALHKFKSQCVSG